MNFYSKQLKQIFTPLALELQGTIQDSNNIDLNDLISRGFLPVEIKEIQNFEKALYYQIPAAFDILNDKCIQHMKLVEFDLPTGKERLKYKISVLRWAFETNGVKYKDYIIPTDTEEQNRIAALVSNTLLKQSHNINEDINFKVNSEFVKFSPAEIAEIGILVSNYVEKCFNAERKLFEIVNKAESITELSKIDVLSYFPEPIPTHDEDEHNHDHEDDKYSIILERAKADLDKL